MARLFVLLLQLVVGSQVLYLVLADSRAPHNPQNIYYSGNDEAHHQPWPAKRLVANATSDSPTATVHGARHGEAQAILHTALTTSAANVLPGTSIIKGTSVFASPVSNPMVGMSPAAGKESATPASVAAAASPVSPPVNTTTTTTTTTITTKAAQFTTFEPELALFVCLIAAISFVLLVALIRKTAETLCTTMPANKAFLPSTLPHPNPPGAAIPFEVKLTEATPEQVAAFMAFRRDEEWHPADGLGPVALEAARYKGELYDAKSLQWEHEHFTLKKKGLLFPFPAPHWNGWAGFWAEVGPYRQRFFLGNCALGLEHVLCGLVMPLLYLWTGDDWYFAMMQYGDLGANVYSNYLIVTSYLTGKNYLLEQYSKSIWHLVATHHVCAIVLCFIGLYYGEQTPHDLGCLLIISLLGTTGALHLFAVAIDQTPWSIEDAPGVRVAYQLATFLSMLFFRALYWVVLAAQITQHTYAMGGLPVCGLTVLALLLFTGFNVEFLSFHWKALKASWKRMKTKKEAKKSC